MCDGHFSLLVEAAEWEMGSIEVRYEVLSPASPELDEECRKYKSTSVNDNIYPEKQNNRQTRHQVISQPSLSV